MLINISFEQIVYSTYPIHPSSAHTNIFFKSIILIAKIIYCIFTSSKYWPVTCFQTGFPARI